jgi:hypothetical protein
VLDERTEDTLLTKEDTRTSLRGPSEVPFREFVTGYVTHALDSAACRGRL